MKHFFTYSSVEVYLESNGKWISFGDMNEPRAWYPATGVLKQLLVVVGGAVSDSNHTQDDIYK